MGMRFRKSINLGGGARVNLSKSGVGFSMGTKGARVTKKANGGKRTTLSVPGTGLSYVKESGAKKNRTSSVNKADRSAQPIEPRRSINECPNCGAQIGDETVCEFCGAQISYAVRRERELVNMKGCPKCGSSNITFRREQQGVSNNKNGARIVYTTTGICMDCGNTWYANTTNAAPKKSNTVWWVLGWIFCFPVPVMILIWRKKCTWTMPVKIGVTVAFWVLFFLTALISGGSSDNKTAEQTSITEESNVSQPTNDVSHDLGDETLNPNADSSVVDADDADEADATEINEEEPDAARATQTMVATEKVKVREQPNTDCVVLGMLAAGASVPVYEQQADGWSLVDYDGKEAYVKSDYLTSEPAETPAVSATEVITEEQAVPPVEEIVPEQENVTVKVSGQDRSVSLPPGTMVWRSETGTKFHNRNDCGNMNSNKASQITVEQAAKAHMEACENCY